MKGKKIGSRNGEEREENMRDYVYLDMYANGTTERRKWKIYDFYNVVIVSGIKHGIIKQYTDSSI